MLQRQKWHKPRKNIKVKDLMLLVDSGCSHGQWPMAVVEEVFPDKHGIVRQVMVRTANSKFKRDVHKLCLLERTKDVSA